MSIDDEELSDIAAKLEELRREVTANKDDIDLLKRIVLQISQDFRELHGIVQMNDEVINRHEIITARVPNLLVRIGNLERRIQKLKEKDE